MVIRAAFRLLLIILPWPIRRLALRKFFGYQIDRSARIGRSWVYPDRLIMGAHSQIEDLTVCKGLAVLELGPFALIGHGNWVTGFPATDKSYFAHRIDRSPRLLLGPHSAVTNRHLIDCTDAVEIGAFATVAGWRSQIMTHSIDLMTNRQSCAPIRIGQYCFVGTDSVILGGSVLPDYSVLGAKSLLNRTHTATHTLYGGVPARAIRKMEPQLPYFRRSKGVVD